MAYTTPLQAIARRFLAPAAYRKIVIWLSNNQSTVASSPTITSCTGAPTHVEYKGSLCLRTDGASANQLLYIATDSAGTWEAVEIDSDFGSTGIKADVVDESTATAGVTVDGVLLKDSEVSTDVINELTAATGVTVDGVLLKDSEVSTDVVNELTAATGVTVDGVLLKDAQVSTDVVNELTAATGVTVDGVLLKDAQVSTDVVNELTLDAGVTVDGVKMKDAQVFTDEIKESTPDSGVTIDGLTLKDKNLSADNILIRAENSFGLSNEGSYLNGFNAQSERYELKWVAGSDGLVQLNASSAYGKDKFFEILGTNASDDDITFNQNCGLVAETDGADHDSIIFLPHLVAGLSPWNEIKWTTSKQVYWECTFVTPHDISNCIMWAGLKLTNTNAKATDADQIYFRYQDTVAAGNWEVVDSIAAALTSTDSGVVCSIDTQMHLKVVIRPDRTAQCYINGALVHTTAALTSAINLIPYVAIQAEGAAAAKQLVICGQSISRVIG